MKADLQVYGAISFTPEWLYRQDYQGRNMLQHIADRCFSRTIDFIAITSEHKYIQAEEDRFEFLKTCIAGLPEGYEAGLFSDNILQVNQGCRRLYIINSQNVLLAHNMRLLVIGRNTINNFQPLPSLLEETADLVQIGPLRCIVEDTRRLASAFQQFDALVGFNAQMRCPWPLVISPFSWEYNQRAQDLARKHNLPAIAVSSSCTLNGIGCASIEFPDISVESEAAFLKMLKKIISQGSFRRLEQEIDFLDWLTWTTKYVTGSYLEDGIFGQFRF